MAIAPEATARWLRRGAAAAAAVLAVGLGLVLAERWTTPQHAERSVGGPFRLAAHDGRMLTDAALRGRPFLAFFGFTHCPDVCPTALSDLSGDLEALGAEAAELTALFITVDPARDDPATLGLYLQSFDRRIVGLTGSEAEIATLAAAYGVYYRKVPLSSGDYTMDHTASVFLMDRAGRFVGTLAHGEAPESRLAKLRLLLARS